MIPGHRSANHWGMVILKHKEKDLYPEITDWFKQYLTDKYKNHNITTTYETSKKSLDAVLSSYGLRFDHLSGLLIKIDILGIITKNNNNPQLAFIEVKDEDLTLKDLGQLWGYTMIANPIESFLISSTGIGSLYKIFKIHRRMELLHYGDGRMMNIVKWNSDRKIIDYDTKIPT